MPRFLGSPAFWVDVSEVAELTCAVLLTVKRARQAAGWACLVLFIAVYPANITMAALRPGPPVTEPPGCVVPPVWYRPGIGIRCCAQPGAGRCAPLLASGEPTMS